MVGRFRRLSQLTGSHTHRSGLERKLQRRRQPLAGPDWESALLLQAIPEIGVVH